MTGKEGDGVGVDEVVVTSLTELLIGVLYVLQSGLHRIDNVALVGVRNVDVAVKKNE